TCARKLFLPTGAKGDEILARLITATKAIKVGNYDDADQPFMGSMISTAAAAGMVKAQDELKAMGGEVLVEPEHTANT
ncbi:aldehyde dehydrogenase family protein, partial [Pseudoalteromonas sp. 41-MNA-CIBAN-0057]|uniref:aldehyde dehydrogenase family protein n=1 Tax=Pseudoalteromonas sp. 41-MNA-CIBAN-0057 TaxID=3140419 RepID=UPI00332FBA65